MRITKCTTSQQSIVKQLNNLFICTVPLPNKIQKGCKGDSGAPMICEGGYVCGVMSHGSTPGCAADDSENRFVRVSRYVKNFIRPNMEPKRHKGREVKWSEYPFLVLLSGVRMVYSVGIALFAKCKFSYQSPMGSIVA